VNEMDPVSIVFAGVDSVTNPALVLVVGQPGSGTSRVAGFVREEHPTGIASVSAENFAAFHPDFLELMTWRPLEASALIAPWTAEWIGQTLDHARETKRSLLFETSINNPGPAIATASAFQSDGFETRLVVVAVRRSESLLATASRYLNARRLRLPARFTDRDTHGRGWIGTQALVREAESTTAVDRLTILSPTGETLFDARRADGFAGATAALEAAQNASVSVLEGARWFGELRAITDFARRSRELAPPLTEVLVELHQLALTDVLPRMPVPRQSSFAVEQENRLAAEILSLRRELPAVPPVAAQVEQSGPVVVPVPSRGGPSL
jgi:UDP-N-acetylglucosamine kinase